MSNEERPQSGLEGRRPPISMKELPALTRKGRAWNYRAIRAGKIKTIWIGDQQYVPPEEADRIGREGVGSLRPADAPSPRPRHRFPRKRAESDTAARKT
jgi:hypothetical protein